MITYATPVPAIAEDINAIESGVELAAIFVAHPEAGVIQPHKDDTQLWVLTSTYARQVTLAAFIEAVHPDFADATLYELWARSDEAADEAKGERYLETGVWGDPETFPENDRLYWEPAPGVPYHYRDYRG